MSLAGFKTLMDGQDTRAKRISVLASPDDAATGLLDYVHDCNKAYWEGVGGTGVTGQVLAAVVDILDVLQGRTTDESLDVLGVLKASQSGLGVGGDITADKMLSVTGDTMLDGALDVAGLLSVDDLLASGDLTVAPGGSFINSDGTYKIVEVHIPEIIGNQRTLLTLDQYSNLLIEGYTGTKSTTYPVKGYAANFGIKQGSTVPFYVTDSGNTFIGYGYTLAQIPFPLASGLNIAGPGGTPGRMTFYSPKYGEVGGSHSGGFIIDSKAEWVPGTDTSTASLGVQIMHTYLDSGSNVLMFLIGGDNTLMLEKDKATISGGSGYNVDFTVRSYYGEPNEYFTRLHPGYASPTNRCIGSGIAPMLQIAGGWSGKTMRLGFDSYHDWNYVRLYMDTQSTSNTIPAISIGKPLGTTADPIDNFIVCDSPWLVALNTNPRTLASLHGDKQGLFIGRGLAGTNDHKMGMLWLEDYTGYSAAIQFGTNVEHTYAFMKNGVLKTYTSSDDSHSVTSGLGTTHPGAHRLPMMTTDFNATTQLSGLVDDIEASGLTENVDGAVILVLSNDDQSLSLMAYSTAKGGWCRYDSTGFSS